MRLLIVLGMATVLLTGCNPAMRNARKQATVDFNCRSGELGVIKRSHDTYVVSGCDRQGIYQCPEAPGVGSRFCVNLSLMARERGEAEFRCELDQVAVDEISPFVFRVAGCEREALYHCEASDGRPRCLAERLSTSAGEPDVTTDPSDS